MQLAFADAIHSKPSVVQRVVFNQLGEPAQVLTLQEAPLPEPGAGQVRVRVRAVPINPSDLLFVQGHYGLQPRFPDSPVGFEGVGEIDAIGTGIGGELRLGRGQRVAFATMGTWCQYVVVPALALMPVPDNLSDEEGAQFFVNPFTALAMLREANLRRGDWLLLTAGFSAVNKILLPIARMRGLRTIATVRRDGQVAPLQALGATAVVNTETTPLYEAVQHITEGRGVRACFESVGGDLGTAALRCLGKDGLGLIYGLMTGQPATLDPGPMIFGHHTVRGFWLSEWMDSSSLIAKGTIAREAYDLMKRGTVRPEVGTVLPLADVQKAVAAAAADNRAGKVVMRVAN